jgi:UDP:flavonoid glycosyltransferase YjiC (YdhE family)
MARFLITTWHLAGHLYPQISVAHGLRARGHDVAFYTGRRVQPLLEAEGFTVFPFRRIADDEVDRLVQFMESRPVGWQAPLLFQRVIRRWWVDTMPAQVEDLREVVGAWRPAALASDPCLWAPFLILRELPETAHVPVAISSFLIGCLIPGRDAPPWGPGLPPPRTWRTRLLAQAIAAATGALAIGVRRRVNQIRATFGLPPLRGSVAAYTAELPLYLVPSLPILDYERRDLPPSVRYVGPCVWNRPRQEAPPAWLDTLPADRPVVHVTEGTAHYQDPFVLRAAAQGLAHRPIHAILTTGPNRDPATLDLGPRAPNIQVEQWVSHSDLLPRCAALVTTGGAGTIMAALQAGVPLVIVPTHWDKPDNAQRVVAAGAGLRLSPRQCTAQRLRDAVERVLHEPRFRARAQELARALAAAPGADGRGGAAELLEALARAPLPTLAATATTAPAGARPILERAQT